MEKEINTNKPSLEINPEIIMLKKWLTAEEVAFYIGMSVHTVREKRRLGEIKGHLIPGSKNNWRYNREEIDRWLMGE